MPADEVQRNGENSSLRTEVEPSGSRTKMSTWFGTENSTATICSMLSNPKSCLFSEKITGQT